MLKTHTRTNIKQLCRTKYNIWASVINWIELARKWTKTLFNIRICNVLSYGFHSEDQILVHPFSEQTLWGLLILSSWWEHRKALYYHVINRFCQAHDQLHPPFAQEEVCFRQPSILEAALFILMAAFRQEKTSLIIIIGKCNLNQSTIISSSIPGPCSTLLCMYKGNVFKLKKWPTTE